MGYIGKVPTAVPITTSDLADGIVTVPKLATTLDLSSNTITLPAGVGGITMADQWRITTGFALGVDTSTLVNSNWEQVDTDGFGNIGSSMSQSSGTWTFPSTGIYFIQWCPQIISPSQGATRAAGEIYTTTDNSTYDVAADNNENIYHPNGRTEPVVNFMFDVTNTTTHKVRLHALCEFAATLHGNSTVNRTYVTFIRLGDT